MEIKLNISKKHLYILMAFVLTVAGIALVIGYGITTPSSFGHSAGEITVTTNGAETSLQDAISELYAVVSAGYSYTIGGGTTAVTPACIIQDVACENYVTTPDYALSGYTDAQCEWIEETSLTYGGHCARCTSTPANLATRLSTNINDLDSSQQYAYAATIMEYDLENTMNTCDMFVSGVMRCCNFKIQ